MTDVVDSRRGRISVSNWWERLIETAHAAGPPLGFGLRVWVSVCLALYIAFWLELDNPTWAATTAAIVCQPSLGVSVRRGWFLLIGTLVGAIASVILAAMFPQDRVGFLLGLALWGGACAFASTVFRNFAGYAAALAGWTTAIVAYRLLGASGGANGDVFTLAVARASEVSVGTVCAVTVLTTTQFGGARRRLAAAIAGAAAEIADGFTEALRSAGSDFVDALSPRRELTRRVIALDQLVEEAIGESFQLQYHSRILQRAMNGLFTALAGWRTAAVHLAQVRNERARAEAETVLRALPPELLSAFRQNQTTYWTSAPDHLRESCEASESALIAMPVHGATLRLLADQTIATLTGISQTLDGLALLVGQRMRSIPNRGGDRHLHASDWLPLLVNGARAFVAIGSVELFWVVTAWPSGALAILTATICVLLLASRAEQAYGAATKFVVGACVSVILAALVKLVVLPHLETFIGLSLAIGAVLIPVGFALAKQWQAAVLFPTMFLFLLLLGPTNPMNYDAAQFFNGALAIVGGLVAGALSFTLIPPLSPAIRARRLLTLALRDLRRLAAAPKASPIEDWQIRILSRLAAFPDQGLPTQRAQLVAALSAGNEIIRLRGICRRLASNVLEQALGALREGNIALAIARFSSLDRDLGTSAIPNALHASASILVICEALTQYRAYFETGAAG